MSRVLLLTDADARIGHHGQGLLPFMAADFESHTIHPRNHRWAQGFLWRVIGNRGNWKAAPDCARSRAAQIPDKTIHSRHRAERLGLANPILRDQLLLALRRAEANGVSARHAPQDRTVRIQYFDGDRSFRGLRQIVVNDSSVGRVAPRGLVRGNRRVGAGAAARPHRRGGLEQRHRGRGADHLAQRTDIIEHPERTAVRGDDQVLIVNHQVAHRGMRQIELQRLPVIAVVERHPHRLFGRGEQQSAP